MAETLAPLTDDSRNQLIMAAVQMAGPSDPTNPGAWQVQVVENAKTITALLNKQSEVAKTIDMIHNAKRFTGTILAAGIEKTSTRGMVYLGSKPTDYNADGIESARTERTDSSEAAMAFVEKLRLLKGHKVLVFIEMQENEKTKKKYRVLQHVVDLGYDSEFDADAAKAKVTAFRASGK